MTFSHEQLTTIAGALRVATLQYEADAVRAREAFEVLRPPGFSTGACRIAEQFERQAEECRAALAALELAGHPF